LYRISPFCEKKIENDFYDKYPFQRKNHQKGKNKNLPKITTTAYNMKGCLRFFLFSYFEYCQIWLNIHMDDCHLSNITKLKYIYIYILKIAVAHDQ